MSTRGAAKRRREQELLLELQRSHGYMFFEYPVRADRHTMQFQHARGTGKVSLLPARKVAVAVPAASWLATCIEGLAKPKGKLTAKRKSKSGKPGRDTP